MNIGFIYFSGTGNTKWVVEYIHNEIEKIGIPSKIYNLAKNHKKDFTEFDNIMIAHPVYGANIPPIVLDKIRNYKFKDNANISIIATYGYVNALGIFKEAKDLRVRIYSYLNIKMFNNISTTKLKSKILSLDRREKLRKKIEKKIDRKITILLKGKRIIDGVGPYLIPGKLIKKIAKDRINDNYKRLSVDQEKCINCMRCIINCPTTAIEKINEEYIFNKNCTSCMRCYNNCPNSAIVIDGVFADPNVYKRYLGPWK